MIPIRIVFQSRVSRWAYTIWVLMGLLVGTCTLSAWTSADTQLCQNQETVKEDGDKVQSTDLLAWAAGPGALPDVAEASQAIRTATQKALEALKAGDAAGYVASLAPDYRQVGPQSMITGKDDVLRSTAAGLSKWTCTMAEFGLTDLRLVSPQEIRVTMTQRVVTATKNTPPTVYKADKGQEFIQNNTVVTHTVTVYHQTWVKRGTDWCLVRSQAVDGIVTAVA